MSDYGALQVTPQYCWHGEAEIIGCPTGLVALRDAITEAIEKGAGTAIVFASDGEGYSMNVRRMPAWPGDDYGKAWANDRPFYEQMALWNVEGERDEWRRRAEVAEAALAAQSK